MSMSTWKERLSRIRLCELCTLPPFEQTSDEKVVTVACCPVVCCGCVVIAVGFVLTFLTSLCHGGKPKVHRPKEPDLEIISLPDPEPEPEIIIVDDPSHPPVLRPIAEHEVDDGQLSPTMRWICETRQYTARVATPSPSLSSSTSTVSTPR